MDKRPEREQELLESVTWCGFLLLILGVVVVGLVFLVVAPVLGVTVPDLTFESLSGILNAGLGLMMVGLTGAGLIFALRPFFLDDTTIFSGSRGRSDAPGSAFIVTAFVVFYAVLFGFFCNSLFLQYGGFAGVSSDGGVVRILVFLVLGFGDVQCLSDLGMAAYLRSPYRMVVGWAPLALLRCVRCHPLRSTLQRLA
jgi:hypothetical protein